MMKFKKLISIASAAVISVTAVLSAVTVNAAGSAYPNGTVTAYAVTDSNFNVSNPSGTVFGKSDQCQILKFNEGNKTLTVKFPVSKGYKTSTASMKYFVYNPDFNKYYTNTKSNVAVYTKPNMSKKIGTVYASDNTLVVSTKGNLSQILYPVSGNSYKMGWIYTSNLKNTGTTATTYYVTANSGLRLRKSASTSSTTLTTMPKGSAVTVYSISYGWAYCKYGNKTGYASASYLSQSKPASSNTKMSYALYKNGSGYLSCGFNGYVNTKGKHEGIDFKYKNGAPVYSLTDGVVVRVAKGYNGSSGLSTIAIYNAATNKTVIYLHSNPLSLKAGQTIKKGQQIATEGWRGVSSASGGHTHVEVRNGKQGYAAKSVGDYKLDNPNPTSFWNSMGYTVK